MFCWTKEVAIVGKKKSFNSGQHTLKTLSLYAAQCALADLV